MKPIFIPLAAAILILSLVASCKEEISQPRVATNSIDTLTDTVSIPLCKKRTGGSITNDSMVIRNDSVYNILQQIVKRATPCKDYIFTEVDFSLYDIIWMRHSVLDNYEMRYTLIRNDSTQEYISISEGYRPIAADTFSTGYIYNQFYRVPKLHKDYTVKFIFKQTWIE